MKKYYVLVKGKKKGPFDESQLKKYKISALLFGFDMVVIGKANKEA
ncbi:MAG: hypothetical protein H0W73_20930 [Bacteroidetes bacterium]|nr:hypothetical protein [Bacteroidota bacterium]